MTDIFNHQPSEYACPFCAIVAGDDNEGEWTKQSDVVLRDELATAFVAAEWWHDNAGHVLVVPNGHFENIYDIPDDVLAAVQIVGKRIALAFKATYGCYGTSFRQHNEPAGNQDVWHYHLHVFPRYPNDELYRRSKRRPIVPPAERLSYAERLRAYFTAR